MDVLYTTNKNYLNYMLASFISFYQSSGVDYINLHIIHNDLNKDDINKINKIVNKLNNVNIFFYNIDNNLLKKYGVPNFRGTQISNARLFFQDIIKDLPNKILYLDSDTICVSKINLDNFNEYSIYATKDCISKKE